MFSRSLLKMSTFFGPNTKLGMKKRCVIYHHRLLLVFSCTDPLDLHFSSAKVPVLTRYFPKELVESEDDPLPVAQYLDLILYSRDQINKENDAMGKNTNSESAPWGIVSIKAQDADYEVPMTPITAMRNALGKDEGGSGVPLDRNAYMEAYKYWNSHATVS